MTQMLITGLFVGILLGFVMQRGRFCLTGGFRDMYLLKDNRMFYALLIAIAIQSVGIFALMEVGAFAYSPTTTSIIGVIGGAFIFGIGIMLAGGCATGTWYRAGEGLIGSWIALAGYMLMATIMRKGPFAPFTQEVKSQTLVNNSIATTFGINNWILVGVLVLIVLIIVYRELKQPKLVLSQLKPKKTGIAHLLLEKRWHPFFTAILVGIIAIIAWPISAATGRIFGLGITEPSSNILLYLTTGDQAFLNWGVFLVLGIFIGSYVAAKLSNEFRFRMPNTKTAIQSFIGGNLMGFGAVLAGGCSIGNALVMTALMTWQGWTALLFMLIGTWVSTYFIFIKNKKRA